MTHSSPSTYLVWSILSITLLVFLISHLWAFDKFRCLRWSSTGGNGAFKRVMTYSYLLSIPLLLVYSLGFTYVKYSEGYVDLPELGIVPRPDEMWAEGHKALIMPLYLLFSISWALEIVSHLEELCFWLFLIHSSESGVSWFRSPHFYLWAVGSVMALGGLPAMTLYTKDDHHQCEAWTFLTGSVGSLALTLLFLPVLFLFPRFLKKVRNEGVEPAVMVRLTKFHSLNISRVACRFVFVIPLLILGIDGVKPKDNHINENPFLTDLLAMLAGFGCVISSTITLLIFFPRSYEQEAGYRFRERPMTQIWSDNDQSDDEKEPLHSAHDKIHDHPPRQDSDSNKGWKVINEGEVTTRFDDDPDPYAYRPSHSLTRTTGQRLSDAFREVETNFTETHYSQMDETTTYQTGIERPARSPSKRYEEHLVEPNHRPYAFTMAPHQMSRDTQKSTPPRPRRSSRRPVWEMVDVNDDDRYGAAEVARSSTFGVSTGVNRYNGSPSSVEGGLSRRGTLHPIVTNYTSPIDLLEAYRR